MSQHLPVSVQGCLKGRSSKKVWLDVAWRVEDALVSGSALHGLVLDIVKAFNALPRKPFFEKRSWRDYDSHKGYFEHGRWHSDPCRDALGFMVVWKGLFLLQTGSLRVTHCLSSQWCLQDRLGCP